MKLNQVMAEVKGIVQQLEDEELDDRAAYEQIVTVLQQAEPEEDRRKGERRGQQKEESKVNVHA